MYRQLSLPMLLVIVLASFRAVAYTLAPDCTGHAAPPQTTLHTKTAQISVPVSPFGITYATKQPNRAFVALGEELGVLNTAFFPPALIYSIPLPPNSDAEGITLSHSGYYLLVTLGGNSVAVVDTFKASNGNPSAILTTLDIPDDHGSGTVEVTFSQGDTYAFVSQEYGLPINGTNGREPGSINVFSLDLPIPPTGHALGKYIGYCTLGQAVVGSALSADGQYLYVASEVEPGMQHGSISILDVQQLMNDTANAVIRSVNSGSLPTRIIVSPDGSQVWVTARGSNALIFFEAASLLPPNAPRARTLTVGTEPNSLTFFRGSSRILIANSNRCSYPGATAGLGVVNADAAASGQPNAYLGQIASGMFPREVALSPNQDTILVSVYDSREIQAVQVSLLP